MIPFLYVFEVKESSGMVIFEIGGQFWILRSPKGHFKVISGDFCGYRLFVVLFAKQNNFLMADLENSDNFLSKNGIVFNFLTISSLFMKFQSFSYMLQ